MKKLSLILTAIIMTQNGVLGVHELEESDLNPEIPTLTIDRRVDAMLTEMHTLKEQVESINGQISQKKQELDQLQRQRPSVFRFSAFASNLSLHKGDDHTKALYLFDAQKQRLADFHTLTPQKQAEIDMLEQTKQENQAKILEIELRMHIR